MTGILGFRALLLPLLCLPALAFTAAGCGGEKAEVGQPSGGPLAAGLERLPDDPELRRHVLVSDLQRLRAAYPEPRSFRDSLVGVWLPDALVGANGALWHGAFGIRLDEVTSFASAGFHPAEVTVALGEFTPAAMRTAFRHSGYSDRGGLLERGADGSIDVTTEVGRLALSSLNRVVVRPERVIAASTSALAQATGSPSRTLADVEDFAGIAAALDPITSAIVLDSGLVRPPSSVPVRTMPEHSARLVSVGIDDVGPEGRTLKIALVYGDPSEASEDAARIERDLESTELPGERGTRFSDIASRWQVTVDDRTVVITGLLAPSWDSGTWRLLVERGDLAPLVRPES